jgi:PmbA protein
MTHFETLADQVKDHLAKKNIDGCEIFIQSRNRLIIEARDHAVEGLQRADELGMAVRLEKNGLIGFAYSNDPQVAALRAMLDRALLSLDVLETECPQRLPSVAFKHDHGEAYYDQSLAKRSLEEKIDRAVTLETAAKAYDKRVSLVRGATYEEEHATTYLWNTQAGSVQWQTSLCQAQLMVVAEQDGGQESAWDMSFSPFFDDLDIETTARFAAAEAVGLLQATSLKTGDYPAILHSGVFASCLGILAPSFLGESLQKNKSRLVGKIGKKIYSDLICLMDDGLYPRGYVSSPCDGEGIESQETVLVEKGVLKNCLYDTQSGQIDHKPSTGNSVRTSFKELPRPGTRNFYLKPGGESIQTLYDGIDSGVAVHDVIGIHTANPITGDFSVGASGYHIDKGGKGRPVRGFAISGNLHDLLANSDGVGPDLKFYGAIGAPSVRIPLLKVGGL